MKKIFSLALLLISFGALAQAQQFVSQQVFTAVASGNGIPEFGGAGTHTISWTNTGSPASCTVAIQTSSDNSSFSNLGTTQTCTSSGNYTVTGTTANYIRVNVSALTAATTVTVTYFGTAPQTQTTTDGTFFVPETACGGATTGTVGTGNATDIVALSGGVRVFRLSATAASGSTNTFTCVFQVPSRLTAGKGVTVTDVTMLVSTQTTQPTSITLPTLKTFSVPAAVDPETANSATFVTSGGTITTAPTSAQFAAYSPVAAGQYFSLKSNLGTPVLVNTDLQVFQLVVPFVQSASAISIQEVAGLVVHYNINN